VRLGIFLEALPLDRTLDYGRRADELGFDTAWLPEITFGDAFVPAAALAGRTQRLKLATGVVGIWSRSPVTMALQAATLHELSNGRAVLGLGVQARGYVANWHGRTYERPVLAMREFVTIVRRILDRELVTLEGEIFRVRNFQLHMPPAERLPIYVAANGPKMLQLAGELADGVLGYFHSTAYVRDVVLPNVRIGAERAGRSLHEIDVSCGLPTVVGDDGRALEDAKGQVLIFATAMGSAPAYADSIAAAGFEAEMKEVQERVARGDMKGAISVIPDEMADALTIAGDPEHVRARIEEYRQAGLTSLHLNPSPPGVYFPLYEGHFPEGAELPEFDFPAYLGVVERTLALRG
jgi:probable F420-dependent oxidoreductase